MEVSVPQQIFYSTKGSVPVGEIAESLLALERLMKHSKPLFEEVFPGVVIDSIDVYAEAILNGSLYEDLVIKFVFGTQENFDEHIFKLRKRIGMDKLDKHPRLLGLLITALITGAIVYLWTGKEAVPSIEANHNTIINIGAGELEMDAKDLHLIIKTLVTKDREVAKSAVSVVRPAKSDPSASIEFNGYESSVITPDAIRDFPDSIPDPEETEEIQDFDELRIQIRATDLDSHKRGWAAVAPALSDERVKLQFDPHIQPEELAKGQTVIVVASVVFKVIGEERKPKLIFVRDVVPDRPESVSNETM